MMTQTQPCFSAAPSAVAGEVLLVTNNFPPVRGGSAVVYENLARFAAGRLAILAPSLHYTDGLPMVGWREHDRRAAYRVVRLPLLRTIIRHIQRDGPFAEICFWLSDLAIRFRLLATLLRLVLAKRPHAICIGELLASRWLIAVLHRLRIARTVVYVHGEEITTDDPYDPGHHRARKALLTTDRIVVVSRFTFNAVRQLIGPDAAQKIRLVENGVDTSRFRSQGRRPDLVDLYGMHGCFVYVSVCRLLEKKGVDNAIRAFASFVEHYPRCRYLIVGTGPYEDNLRALAVELAIGQQVLFAGEVSDEDLVAHYCLGDVFVMPNRELANGDTEGFGLVFLEANSCGLPVISGRDGGSCDAVRDGENGLVVDGRSVKDIAAAMKALYDDPALRARISNKALEIAKTADWQSKAMAFLQLCTEPNGTAKGTRRN